MILIQEKEQKMHKMLWKFLENNILPIINENDVIANDELYLEIMIN